MPFMIVRDDITRVTADAIVNSANPEPTYKDGTDRAVYEAAGAEAVLAERRRIGAIAPGSVAATGAYALKARYILHTVGPRWQGGDHDEAETLARCYRSTLSLAEELGCRSIAFPLISTGIYGFPRGEALQIAFAEISAFLTEHEMDIRLVVFDPESFRLSGRVFDDIAALITEAEVHEQARREYVAPTARSRRGVKGFFTRRAEEPCDLPMPMEAQESDLLEDVCEASVCRAAPCCDEAAAPESSLEELLSHRTETFQQCLLRMIDERGLKDSEVYRRANLDRRHFSKIRSDVDYHPKKKTAVAFAIALRLDLEETKQLLSTAEWALSTSSRFDIIVTYFIRNQRYDIVEEINPALFRYGQPLLGA